MWLKAKAAGADRAPSNGDDGAPKVGAPGARLARLYRLFTKTKRPDLEQTMRIVSSASGGGREAAQPADPKTFFASIWRQLAQHVLFVTVFSAAINLLYLAPSLFMLQIYDRVVPSRGVLTLIFLVLVLIVALGTMSFLDSARAKLLARASLLLERTGARTIMREMLAARRDNPQSVGSGGVKDLDTLRQGIASPAMLGLIDLPWTPLFIFVCFVIHFWIGILALGGAVLIFGLALWNERTSRRSLTAYGQKAQQFHVAHDNDLVAAETVHAIGAESALIKRRLAAREDVVSAQMDSAMVSANFSALTKFVRQFLQSSSLALGAYLAVEHQISSGAIIVCSILTARAYAPVEQIVGGWRQIALAFAAHANIDKLLKAAPNRAERTPLPAPSGKIRLDGVVAMPPGSNTPAITNISFMAAPGEIIAIIGPSGAGKSALARVLANAAQPRAGTIRIDGARYVDWEPSALAAHIGYMPQRVDLFDGTVAENISRFARYEGFTMDEVGPRVVEAATLAGAHELILSLPNGYESMLGYGGAGLSPGQTQRIALARALYGSPRVVVLDEPNAHLDSDGEDALVKMLQHCKSNGVTSFIVAHRSGVLGVVDKLLVLTSGQIVAFGPKDEVLAQLSGRGRNANAVVGESA